MSEIISKQELKKLINETLLVTDKLIQLEGVLNTGDVKFKDVLNLIFKRSYLKLYSISVLARVELTGDSIMALSRGLIEEMISIHFMKLKGKDKMAQKFVDYMYVDKKLEYDIILASGKKVDEETIKQGNEDYEKVAKQFLRGDGQISHSWAKCSTEAMLIEMIKSKEITEEDNDILTQAYIMGNRKIHLSPYDVATYFNASDRDKVSKIAEELGMMIALICIFSIAKELINETGYDKISDKLEDIEDRFWEIVRRKP